MKKTTWKRIVACLVGFVMTAAMFTACGSSNEAQNASSAASAAKSEAQSAAASSAAEASEASAPAATGESIVLTFADFSPEGCATSGGEDELAKQVYEATDGRVEIKVYHNGTLGAQPDSLTMLETGVCDICWIATALFAGQFNYSDVMQIPLMGVKDCVQATDIMWNLMDEFPEMYEKEFEGYHLIACHAAPANVLGLDKELNTLADMKGSNVRASAGIGSTMIQAFGGSPASIAPADLYTSMQKGVVNGYVGNGTMISTWKLAELSTTIVDAGLGYCPLFWLCTEDKWNQISPEDQAIIETVCGRDGSMYLAQAMQDEADALYESFVAGGGDFKQITTGDPLYEEMKAAIEASTALDDWKAATSTADFDSQEMIDYLAAEAAK